MSFIKIENPCTEDVNRMPKCGQNYYCSLCSKKVVDLRKSLVSDAQWFVNQNPNACIVVHPRHAKSGFRYNLVNGIEKIWMSLGFKRVALVSSTILLFITGCNTRRHTHHPGGKAAVKNNNTLYETHR